jgi:hypothetical protein
VRAWRAQLAQADADCEFASLRPHLSPSRQPSVADGPALDGWR